MYSCCLSLSFPWAASGLVSEVAEEVTQCLKRMQEVHVALRRLDDESRASPHAAAFREFGVASLVLGAGDASAVV